MRQFIGYNAFLQIEKKEEPDVVAGTAISPGTGELEMGGFLVFSGKEVKLV